MYARLIATCVCLLCLAACQDRKPISAASDELPPSIQAFREEILNRHLENPDMGIAEIQALAIARFGRETRNTGSGRYLPEWDIDGGILCVGGWPRFETADGKSVELIHTKNPVSKSITQPFDMYSFPQPPNDNYEWLGTLTITPDLGNYHFERSHRPLERLHEQFDNFFFKHPKGKVQIRWPDGISSDSLLSTLGDRTIAHLTFISDDNSQQFQGDLQSVDPRPAVPRLTLKMPTAQLQNYWMDIVDRDKSAAERQASLPAK